MNPEQIVRYAWRFLAYRNDKNPTASEVSKKASEFAGENLSVDFVTRIAQIHGYTLQ